MSSLTTTYSYRAYSSTSALATSSRVLGPDHPATDGRRKDLAELLYDDPSRTEELRVLLEESLASQRRSLGPDHPSTLRSLANLALLAEREGDFARSEELLREAYAGFRARYGAEHFEALVTESDLADLLLETGRAEEAEPLARHTVEVGARTLSPDALELGRFRLRWAFALRELGRFEQAREVLHEVARLAETRGADDLLVRYALQELASLPAATEPGSSPHTPPGTASSEAPVGGGTRR